MTTAGIDSPAATAWLIDKSALARLGHAVEAELWARLIGRW